MKKAWLFGISLIMSFAFLTACNAWNNNGNDVLSASGTISATSIKIAPEVGGKVAEIAVKEGDQVKVGDLLFRLDDELLNSQHVHAQAVVEVAQAALNAANDQLSSAEIQYAMASQASNAAMEEYRRAAWDKAPMTEFDLPVWYFSQAEEIRAAQTALERANSKLKTKQADLEKVLANIANADFVKLEQQLSLAQYELMIADAALDISKDAAENKELKKNAEDVYDLAESNLEKLQKEYDQALTSTAAEEVLKARAEVAVTQTQVEAAKKLLNEVRVGDDSLAVQAAAAAMQQAQSQKLQAEANLTQAEASLGILEVQLKKCAVYAPIDGQIFLQNMEVGELVNAGSVVMKLGNLDEVKLTVYVPEDKYGLVSLGQDVNVAVDSYPEKIYPGKVTYIADEAEFTPSNVQTVEGRKSTVFAIEITLENKDHELKPGMPADVKFIFK